MLNKMNTSLTYYSKKIKCISLLTENLANVCLFSLAFNLHDYFVIKGIKKINRYYLPFLYLYFRFIFGELTIRFDVILLNVYRISIVNIDSVIYNYCAVVGHIYSGLNKSSNTLKHLKGWTLTSSCIVLVFVFSCYWTSPTIHVLKSNWNGRRFKFFLSTRYQHDFY